MDRLSKFRALTRKVKTSTTIAVKGGSILKTQVLQNTPEGADPDDPSSATEAEWDAVNLSDHFPIICDIEF